MTMDGLSQGDSPFVSLSAFELSTLPVRVVLILQRRNESECVITLEGPG